jgi:ABC-type branched-subunit amino acid transport system substrate-binding protein
MNKLLRRLLAGAAALWLGLATWPLEAEAQIRIGQTASFTGPVASGVKEGTDGARAYIDAVNARGGVGGVPIELISLDDKFDPKLAADNARTLIERGVVALFFNRGTPQTEAIMPVLMEKKVPLIAPSTGAMSLHEPVHPWIFNVRATYQREAERAVRHLWSVGTTRIALVHSDDSFGTDGVTGALKGFQAVDGKPVLQEKYSRAKPDFGPVVPKVVQAQAQAVVFIGAGNHVVDGVKALRAAGSRAQIVTLSNNAASGFIKALGEHARGVVVSQVFPNERSLSVPLIKELHDLLRAKGSGAAVEITPAMVEGFAAAKVLVEALRRAGPEPGPVRIKSALESMRKLDIGGLELSFSPTDHTGLDYSDLSIIGADGKFVR